MWGKRRMVASGIPEHIVRRVSVLATPDLTDWADQAIYSSGRYLTLYRRSRDPRDLEESLIGAQVLLAINEELRRRSE